MRIMWLFTVVLILLFVSMMGCAEEVIEEVEEEVPEEVEEDVPGEVEEELEVGGEVTITPDPIPIDSDQEITISGSGFPPDADVSVSCTTGIPGNPDVLSANLLDGKLDYPRTDSDGNFTASYILDRLAGVVSEEVEYSLTVIVNGVMNEIPMNYKE